VVVALGLEQLVQLGLGERRVAAKVEREAAPAVARDDGLEDLPPPLGAVDLAGPEHAALQVAELVEQA
jgi:hypothetical protein